MSRLDGRQHSFIGPIAQWIATIGSTCVLTLACSQTIEPIEVTQDDAVPTGAAERDGGSTEGGSSTLHQTPAPNGEDPESSDDGQGNGVLDDNDAEPEGESPPPSAANPGSSPDASGLSRLFRSHSTKYAAGTILPKGTQASLDSATAAFYDAWKKKYLVQGCGSGRYYVGVNPGGGGMSDKTITVSEAHGYGMIITAFMAGHDPKAQTEFDGMYKFFRDHPSKNHPDLMAWNQVDGCKNNPKDGDDSATDGDLDIAFALLLADKQWGSTGTIKYLAEAKKVIAAIRSREISIKTQLATLGDWVTADDDKYYNATRPSDFHTDHFRAFGKASGQQDWTKVLDAHYKIVASVQASHSSKTGLLPDFIVSTDSSPKPAPANFLEEDTDGQYAYNSCRVPMRLGIDYLLSGEARALGALKTINTWIRSKTGNSAPQIDDGYDLSGRNITASVDNTIAFVAPFGVSAMAETKNQAWLDAIWDLVETRPIDKEDYYGNTIKMLSMIVMSGNWWTP